MGSISWAFDWDSAGDWFADEGVWFIVTLVAGLVAYLAFRKLAPRIVRPIVFRMNLVPTEKELEQQSESVSRLVVRVGTLVLAAAVVFASLPRFGVDISPAVDAVVDWLAEHGPIIALIVFLAFVTNRVQRAVVRKVVEKGAVRGKGRRRPQVEFGQRVDTLSGFISQILAAVVWVLAVFMILSEMGVNVGPLLAGAGIVGIALGFGAQTLVKDVISGLFIIIENQYHKGDWITIAGLSGSVEEVNMRRTVLRDLDGIVHVVSNGEVRLASNFTREYGRVNFDISVGYGEDLDRAIAVINRVGQEMAEEEYWGKAIIEPPHVLRVNSLGDSGIDIKVYGNTKRMRQWEIMGELRKRIKGAFDDEGIEIPWPHTKVYFGNPLEQGARGKAKAPPPKAVPEKVGEAAPPAKVSRRRAKEKFIPEVEESEGFEGDGG